MPRYAMGLWSNIVTTRTENSTCVVAVQVVIYQGACDETGGKHMTCREVNIERLFAALTSSLIITSPKINFQNVRAYLNKARGLKNAAVHHRDCKN